jgi:hypothetical protein
VQKLGVIAAALLLTGSAYAAEGQQGSTKEETKEAAQAAGRDVEEGAAKARDTMKEQGQKADQAVQQSREGAPAGRDQPAQAMKRDSFDIEGKVSKVSKSALTLKRDDGPPATLHVDKSTRVKLDGDQVAITQLKPGQEVKASFDLQGDKPLAGEIKADSKK